jgi:hypothetical protein
LLRRRLVARNFYGKPDLGGRLAGLSSEQAWAAVPGKDQEMKTPERKELRK